MPFSGLDDFYSKIVNDYHNIIYYGNNDLNHKNNLFFYTLLGKTFLEEQDFIKKNILLIKYLNDYIETENHYYEDKTKGYETKYENFTKNLTNMFTDILDKLKTTKKIVNNTKKTNQKGGSWTHSLVNNTKVNVDKNKSTEFYRQELVFSEINKATFRLNHNFDVNGENYLLISGDISIRLLIVELSDIINSRSNYEKTMLKIFTKSVPFFVDDYLIDLLVIISATSYNAKNIYATRIFIIEFIKEYINNFTKLYSMAMNDLFELLNNPEPRKYNETYSKLLLNKLYKANLTYTLFQSSNPDILYRDRINYTCILLKYCKCALDHIVKRFKINIIKYDYKIHGFNKFCENKLNEYFDFSKSTEKPRNFNLNPYSEYKIKNFIEYIRKYPNKNNLHNNPIVYCIFNKYSEYYHITYKFDLNNIDLNNNEKEKVSRLFTSIKVNIKLYFLKEYKLYEDDIDYNFPTDFIKELLKGEITNLNDTTKIYLKQITREFIETKKLNKFNKTKNLNNILFNN